MAKLDPKKQLGELYLASRETIRVIDVPPLRYLMVDGEGDPNTSPWYAQAVEALFSISYTAKFMMKNGPQAIDYSVMPLEGLWWADDMSAFIRGERSQWQWTMMILQPDFVPDQVIEEAMTKVRKAKPHLDVDKVRLEVFHEGRAAQLLHVGPFSEEGPAIQRLNAFIEERSRLRGKHHEIYLSDVRRAEPAKWRTILRQPME